MNKDEAWNNIKAMAIQDIFAEIQNALIDNNATNLKSVLLTNASTDLILELQSLIKLARNKRETIRRAVAEVN